MILKINKQKIKKKKDKVMEFLSRSKQNKRKFLYRFECYNIQQDMVEYY